MCSGTVVDQHWAVDFFNFQMVPQVRVDNLQAFVDDVPRHQQIV